MTRPTPSNFLTASMLLLIGFFTTTLFTTTASAQTPLPYDAVPVEIGDAAPVAPHAVPFSDPGYRQPFVRSTQAVSPVYQPVQGTIPQTIHSSYDPNFYAGTPMMTQPVPMMSAPANNVIPQGMYDQGYGRSGLITGFAFVFLKPHYNNNNAFTVQTAAGLRDVNAEFDWDTEVSPRIWVEFVGNDDFGARLTYWQFDHDSANSGITHSAANPFFPVNLNNANVAIPGVPSVVGDTIAAGSSLNIYTIDAEFTQRMRLQKWQANVGGGFRHAGVHQRYGAAGTYLGNAAYAAYASHRFDGVGPTLFAELRRPMWNYGFSLVASVRGSLLYGESKRDATDNVPVVASLNTTNGQVVPVGEVQLGAEWSTWVSHTSVFYFQVAWEGQYWGGLGNATTTEDDLGLLGLNTTLGWEW